MSKYEHLDRETLIRLLQRRDAQQPFGLVWEREDDEVRDHAVNQDFVALELDPSLSQGDAPWPNLIIEGGSTAGSKRRGESWH